MVNEILITKEEKLDNKFEDFAEESESLLNSLRKNIESGKYTIVLGVDSSGRLPALLVSEIIKKSKPENNSQTVFIATERSDYHGSRYYADLNERIEKLPPGSSILLIDDTIHRGDSILPLITKLKEHGMSVDVGVLSIQDEKEFNPTNSEWKFNVGKNIQRLNSMLGVDIHYGSYGPVSSVYGNADLSGVRKLRDSEIDIRNKKGELPNMTTAKPELHAEDVAEARKAVKIITNRILKNWSKNSAK